MKFRKLMACGIAAGIMALAATAVSAATITTEDGVLSIETPSDDWQKTTDPLHWLVVTDGKDTITVDHLSNGEALPATVVANDEYKAVYQGFVSTRNEVFVVKGLSNEQEDLQKLMETIGTIRVLKLDTKQAITKADAPKAYDFGLRPINAVYRVISDELNVRRGCSIDDTKIGELYEGDQVTVDGAVTKNGQDFGWYQIQFNGGKGYVSAQFLVPVNSDSQTPAKPSTTTTAADPTSQSFTVYTRQEGGMSRLIHKVGDHFESSESGYANIKWYQIGESLFRDDHSNYTWSSEPGYIDSDAPTNSDYTEYFTIYSQGSSVEQIHKVADHFENASGSVSWYPTSDGLYQDNVNNSLWSTDPNYFGMDNGGDFDDADDYNDSYDDAYDDAYDYQGGTDITGDKDSYDDTFDDVNDAFDFD